MRKALILSVVVHLVAVGAGRPAADLLARQVRIDASGPDVWTGDSIELFVVAGGETASVSNGSDATPGAAHAVALPAPASASEATTTQAAVSTAPSAVRPPAENGRKPPATQASPSHSRDPVHPPNTDRPRPSQHRPRAPSRSTSPGAAGSPAASSTAVASAAPAASTGAGAGGAGSYGSEGSAAVRDLGRAFTRAIPAACSADPIWARLAVGDAGTLKALLRVDESGHLGEPEVLDKTAPKALVSALKRTAAALQAGIFAVRGGTVSAGTETIELSATVSDEEGGETAGGRDHLASRMTKVEARLRSRRPADATWRCSSAS